MAVRALTFLLVVTLTHAFVKEAVEVIKLGEIIGVQVLRSWRELHNASDAEAPPTMAVIDKALDTVAGTIRNEKLVFERLEYITDMIKHLEQRMAENSAVAMLLARTAGRKTKLELSLHEMADLLSRVALSDQRMRRYVSLQNKLERSTLENFAEWCVSYDPGALPGLLERIHSLITPPHKHLLGRSILDLVLNDLQDDHPDLCDNQMSTHQLIYDMYQTIYLTEIKGYAMMQFSWMLLRIYGKGNFTYEAKLAKERYEERTSRTADAARAALVVADRDLFACDLQEHQQGETYEEVTRLMQGYIANEVDMHPSHSCWKNCDYFQDTDHKMCRHHNEFCGKQTPCRGRISNCRFIASDMWVCRAGQNSNRRYDWIEYENGRKFGEIGHCYRGTTKVSSWRRWIFWQCSYCMCLCDEADSNSDRYFSLRDSTSDIENNKVVTGLRIVKRGQVFHLQISEGTLGQRGSISSVNWVPVQTFDISDYGVQDTVDYHTLSYERRAIDLDKLESPAGYVLTGVRFGTIGSHLHLEIRSTPFNYTTGRLSPGSSQWISNTEDEDYSRSRLKLYSPDIPTRSSLPLPVDSNHNQYVEFTHSDFEADAAQSTVPFIDIQPLKPIKGLELLSGAGLYHRGQSFSGGFIAAKLVTYDYSPHVEVVETPPPF